MKSSWRGVAGSCAAMASLLVAGGWSRKPRPGELGVTRPFGRGNPSGLTPGEQAADWLRLQQPQGSIGETDPVSRGASVLAQLFGSDVLEHVCRVGDERGMALADQLVGAGGEGGCGFAGDGVDRSADLDGEVDGDEGAASFAGFDDHDDVGECRDDPVACLLASKVNAGGTGDLQG